MNFIKNCRYLWNKTVQNMKIAVRSIKNRLTHIRKKNFSNVFYHKIKTLEDSTVT